MKSLASLLWTAFGSSIKPGFLRNAANGQPWALPSAAWRRVSFGQWLNLKQALLDDAENEARSTLRRNDHPLSHLFSEVDLSNDWAISPLTILYLWNTVNRNKPQVILELGSGLSSILFACFAQRTARAGYKPPSIVSVDHDEQWLLKTKDRLGGLGLAQFANLTFAPLADMPIDDIRFHTYSKEPILESMVNKSADFCLIDGPPMAIGRTPCLPLVAPFLQHDACVMLDDFYRPGEQEAVRFWTDHFRKKIGRVQCVLTGKGVGRFTWKGSLPKTNPQCVAEMQASL
jgi:predicted O-methyltransferase YrrM